MVARALKTAFRSPGATKNPPGAAVPGTILLADRTDICGCERSDHRNDGRSALRPRL